LRPKKESGEKKTEDDKSTPKKKEKDIHNVLTTHQLHQIMGMRYWVCHTSIIREYMQFEIAKEFTIAKERMERQAEYDGVPIEKELTPFELDRVIDDFVFIFILIGNDFLPGLPSLDDVYHGTMDYVWMTYLRCLPTLDGYLTDRVNLHPKRIATYLRALAEKETSQIFYQYKKGYKGIQKKKYLEEKKKQMIAGHHDSKTEAVVVEKEPMPIPENLEDVDDEKLRQHYYTTKFGWEDEDFEKNLAALKESWRTGAVWVMRYYYAGLPSWSWFYPYHYAPLASDLADAFDDLKEPTAETVVLPKGRPFKPFEQLLSVLPPQSATLLPKPLRSLMTSPTSPLSVYYPDDFTVDMFSADREWMGIVQLPFIDETLLVESIKKVAMPVDEQDKKRNAEGTNTLFCKSGSAVAKRIGKVKKTSLSMDFETGISGLVYECSDNGKLLSASYNFMDASPLPIKYGMLCEELPPTLSEEVLLRCLPRNKRKKRNRKPKEDKTEVVDKEKKTEEKEPETKKEEK